MSNVTLSLQEIQRYSRHLILPQMGMEGQRRLKQGSVLVIGTGGLGSPLLLYLAAAGVGHIGLVDFDTVDQSNLQRQIIHATSTVGMLKTQSARSRLQDLNPLIEITTYDTRLSSENAMEILQPYDVIVDATDNFATRYLTNDACALLGKANVYGSIYGFEGQCTVFFPKEGGPCYRCLYPEPPPPGLVPSCADAGVLGIVPGVIGTIQATEVVKLLTGIGTPLIGQLLLYDALDMQFRKLKLRPNPECPVCSDHPTLTHLIDYEQFCGTVASADTLDSQFEITPSELASWLEHDDRPLILDVRYPFESDVACIPGTTHRIPLYELSSRSDELLRDRDIVVYCRVGQRSAKAVMLLRDAGFETVKNLVGGILRWADDVDPTTPKY